MTSCEDANVTKLKKQVAVANADCPVNMGVIGDLLSIKYQEKENRVILYYSINEEISGALFLKSNKAKLHQQFRISFSKNSNQQMLKDIVDAKASLMMIYKSPSSGKTIKFELPYEDLKAIQSNPISESEIQRLTIENKIELENSKCPYEADEGMKVTKISLVDNMVVYYSELDESIYDIQEFKRLKDGLKNNIGDYFENMHRDPQMQHDLQLFVNQNIGYQYRYYGNKSKDYVDVIFTPEELSKYLK